MTFWVYRDALTNANNFQEIAFFNSEDPKRKIKHLMKEIVFFLYLIQAFYLYLYLYHL